MRFITIRARTICTLLTGTTTKSQFSELSTEDDLTDKIKKTKINDVLDKLSNSDTLDIDIRSMINKNVSFRFKERTSLYINDTDTHFIRIDLTDTKTSNDFNKLFNTIFFFNWGTYNVIKII